MAYDLTLTSPTFNASGWSGQSLNGGYGYLPVAQLWAELTAVVTIEARVKMTGSGAIGVAVGSGGTLWFGCDASGYAHARIGDSSVGNRTLSTTIPVNDGNWHHLELSIDDTNNLSYFFVDGVLTNTPSAAFGILKAHGLGVRRFTAAGDTTTATTPWLGEVDEVALWSVIRHTASFTPAAVPSTGSGLLAVWRLDGDGLNGAGVAPVLAVTLSGPASGTVGVASANFTVGASDALTGSVVVTPSDGGAGGTFTPATVTISAGTPTATLTYTAASIGAKTISVTNDGGLTNPSSITYTAASAVNNAYNKDSILWSPYNWNVQPTFSAAINAGAYFKTEFGGATCELQFDVASVASPVPHILYRIDGAGPWNKVDVAASVTLSIPTETSAFPNHLLEVMVKSTSEATNRWDGTSNVVTLTGVILAAGKVLTKPDSLPLHGLYFGDSITEGINTIGNTGDATVRSSAAYAWSLESAALLGAEAGNVGFGKQGLVTAGNGSVPVFGSTWGYIYSGVARVFDPKPDYIVINQGANDGTSNITSAYTTALNGLLAATDNAHIFCMRPFGGAEQAANIQAAIAACTDPARVTYVDTAGWFNVANSFGAPHPNGFEGVANLAPKLADVVRDVIHPVRGKRTARTVSLDMVNASGSPVTSVSGLRWAFFDGPSPDLFGVPADQGAVESIDASGVLIVSVRTTLPPGGIGWLVVTDSDGTTTQTPAHKAFSGPAEVV